MKLRYSDDITSFWGKMEQNYLHPLTENLCSYNRHIIGISYQRCNWWMALQFIFSDGTRTDVDAKNLDPTKWVDELIPECAVVSRVQLVHDRECSGIVGIRFTDREGMSLLDVGDLDIHNRLIKQFSATWVNLGNGERLVGLKSGQRGESGAFHCDLQFIIGKKM